MNKSNLALNLVVLKNSIKEYVEYIESNFAGNHSVGRTEMILKLLINQIPFENIAESLSYTDAMRKEDLVFIDSKLSDDYSIDDILRIIIDNIRKGIFNFEKSFPYKFYFGQ